MNLIALPWFVGFSSDGYSNFKQSKVAYGGVFPSKDWRGHDFSGSRASLAGKCISGGPYVLTEVRLGLVDNVNLTSKGHQLLAFGMSLTRGDWKWHKEVFDLRHF